MAILNPAPSWQPPRNELLTLYHGCTTKDRDKIEQDGVKPEKGRPNTDFGQGFYTTTLKRQARHWAWARFYAPEFAHASGYQPVILTFQVERHELAKLAVLSFQLGDYNQDDYWSLVQHCRQSSAPSDPKPHTINSHFGPQAENGGDWYDVVCGPVAAFWEQRSAMQDSDQFSFHTTAAVKLLNDLISKKNTSSRYSSQIVTN
ncbi:hypothetical protein Pan97_23810 [Bremerella volcania]|uniref:DUF3990 domain-containing protein n=1 Tax=Bremerella volcania TaxID=2527984 RepID=A0A518C7Z9_9BACT|nr:DUF3990 domain-containing protein [Bremerella volcania]QDU75351.1 hypothetical protein Pan97_23810 [Bremerella volcania]